jgi:phenylacetate-CoA ligase
MTSFDRPYFDPRAETMPREALEEMQGRLLRDLVARACERNPFYRRLYREAGVRPADIRSVSDVRRLPFTDKRAVQDAYPFGLLLCERPLLRELHAGTSPRKQILPVWATAGDLAAWAARCARILWMAGLRPGHRIQNAFRFGLSTGGFGFHYGAQAMGMLSLPASTGGTDAQIDALVDLEVDAIAMMPSYAMYLGMRAQERGIDLALRGKLKVGLFGAEPYSAQMKGRLEELLGLVSFNEYGMNEFLGPGMAAECPRREGLHAWADHFLLECVDPASGEPVAEGEAGELVWTHLSAQAMGVIRYRSHDLSRVTRDVCACGRTHPRFTPIGGRSDEVLSIGGYVVYPSRFAEVISSFRELGRFAVILDSVRGLDRLTLRVEAKPAAAPGDAASRHLRARVEEAVRSYVGVTPRVELVEPGDLGLERRRTERPAGAEGRPHFRIIDYRKGSGRYGV